MVEQEGPVAVDAVRASVSALTRYYVLAMLILVTTVSIMDRQIIGILIEPIRADLHLSDTLIGALGLTFALVYTAACFPIARLADRWSRVNVIAIAITCWSVMTAVCGFAQNAAHIFLARIGVAVTEAGGTTPSHALIGDLFPRDERGTAMSVLMICSPLGLSGGLFLGGWAVEEHGWRAAFFIAGALGVLIGPLVYFTVPKVQMGMADGVRKPLKQAPFLATMRQLLAIRSLIFMLVAAGLQTLLAMGLTTWAAPFLVRSHGMSIGDIGAALGAALGTGSLIGHLAGGPLLDWLGRYDLRWHFWMAALIGLVSGALAIVAILAPTEHVIWLLGAQIFVSGLFSGPMIAIIMNLAPVTARATASATLTLMTNVIGLGFGPQLIGVLSDAFRPEFGEESLRIALLCATAIVIPAAILNYMASLTYRADMASVEAGNKVAAA